MAETKKANNGKLIFFIVIIAISTIGYCNRNKGSSDNNSLSILNSNSNTTNLESLKSTAFVRSQDFVKNRLKSPSTADFPTIDYKCIINDADSTFKITSYVDSQNGFGATIRTDYEAVLKYTGGDGYDNKNWQLMEINLYDRN